MKINKRHYYVNRDNLGSRSLFYGSKYESLTLKNHIPIQKQSFRRQLTSFISEFWFNNLIQYVVHQIKTIKLVEFNFIFKENALFERKSKAKNKFFLTFDLNYAKT